MRMELAAALHHFAFKSVGPETNDALRSQKTVNSKKEAVFFELHEEDTEACQLGRAAGAAGTGSAVRSGTSGKVTHFASLFKLCFRVFSGVISIF